VPFVNFLREHHSCHFAINSICQRLKISVYIQDEKGISFTSNSCFFSALSYFPKKGYEIPFKGNYFHLGNFFPFIPFA